jgi:hypothetical protein
MEYICRPSRRTKIFPVNHMWSSIASDLHSMLMSVGPFTYGLLYLT